MKLTNHPALLEQLAASHALGTLRGGARRRFEALARDSVTIRTQALLWQERLASLTELQPSEAPSANVWKRIANAVENERQKSRAAPPAPKASAPRGVSAWWRGAAAAGALATVAGLVVGVQQHRQLGEQVNYSSNQGSSTSMRFLRYRAIDWSAHLGSRKPTLNAANKASQSLAPAPV